MNTLYSTGLFCPRLDLKPSAWATVSPDRVFKIYTAALAHFSSIPWASALINPGSDANAEIVTFTPRGVNPMTDTRGLFLRNTLVKPQALQHMLCFVRTSDVSKLLDPAKIVRRMSILFSLGDGLSSHAGIIHGGMLATMFDETLGTLHELNQALNKTDPAYVLKQNLTAEIKIKFLKPASTGDVLAEGWIESVKGRKIVMRGEIRDRDGTVLAECTSTWISPRSRL